MSLNANTRQLLAMMADGECHSGEALGRVLGVSRAAVWKHLQRFSELGVLVQRVRGSGYCIEGGLSLLDKAWILSELDDADRESLTLFDVLDITDSTNKHLMERLTQGESLEAGVCLAEMQTAGRGRRGRQWQSPFARNIYASIVWPFETGINGIEGLSLAVGVAVVESLTELGLDGVSLKWPNDILYEGKKLGGILIEIAGDVSDRCHVVVGVGLNVDMPIEEMAGVDQPWIDMSTLMSSIPSRNRIAAVMLKRLFALLREFELRRFACYRAAWEAHNAHRDMPVRLLLGNGDVEGVMLGVDDSGALRLSVDGVEQVYIGGEISLRSLA